MNKSLVTFLSNAMYGSVFFVLFTIDYILGNGLVDMLQRCCCKITGFVKKTIRKETKEQITGLEQPVNLPVLFAEILVLTLTAAILTKYKQFRGTDRIDELLQDSKDALRETNEFLEKWRLRRINWQQPTEYSYLDEEPQEIKPLKLETPLLHMAIIDTLGTSRNQPERGDAGGDAFTITDSTLLSLLDKDMDYPEPVTQTSAEKLLNYNSRYLWDLIEEDDSNLEEM